MPFLKWVLNDYGEEYQAFEDNIYLYDKMADFLRDSIDSYRVMVRQKDYQKFDDL